VGLGPLWIFICGFAVSDVQIDSQNPIYKSFYFFLIGSGTHTHPATAMERVSTGNGRRCARWRLHKWHRRHPVPLEESRRQLLLNMCASEWRSGHALSTLMYNTAQRRACSHPGSFSFSFFGHPTAADLSPFCHLKGSHV
jgi:hypothetical protein